VNKGCYLSLPHSWYPYLEIKVDEKKIEPIQSAYGMIVLPINKGRHTIKINPVLSPLRKYCLVISLLSLTIVIIFIVYLSCSKKFSIR